MTKTNRAVFLDRDGTVVVHISYARSPEQIHLLPGAAQAICEFRRRGYLAVLVTNQSGVGRGHFTEADLQAQHHKLRADLAAGGAALDGIYHCPHLPAELLPPGQSPCDCRKPKPGMIRRAASELNVDLSQSYMIGDSAGDIQAGKAAGCGTGLVVGDRVSTDRPINDFGADFVVHDLLDVLPHLDDAT